MPTYMSAVPRSTALALLGRELQRALVGAHRLARADPARSRMSASKMVQPSASETCPARCKLAMPAAYVRCAVSRSPVVQAARPRQRRRRHRA